MTAAVAVTVDVAAAQKKNIGCKQEYVVEEHTVSRLTMLLMPYYALGYASNDIIFFYKVKYGFDE